MQTIGARLAEAGARPVGFDYLRFCLACAVVGIHAVYVCFGNNVWQTDLTYYFRPLYTPVLPMFFTLGGFLVSGSLERSKTLVSFLGLRVLRLLPALLVESLIAMLLIGPLFTKMPLGAYFRDPVFWSYLDNLIGDVHFHLPGVFLGNPVPLVNLQLWTLPFDLYCYGLLAIITFIALLHLGVGSLIAFGDSSSVEGVTAPF